MKIWPDPSTLSRHGIGRYLREISGAVWREQKNAYDEGLNLQEETITECLLLQMARDLPKSNFRVKMFTRHREAEIGADWVWFFILGQCRVGFRVQAKKLYKRVGVRNRLLPGRYDGILQKKHQAQDLINRAGPNNPIYVFYNHSEISDAHFFNQPSKNYRGSTFWGCSFATANFVNKAKSGYLRKLESGMRPLHELIGFGTGCVLANGLKGIDPDYKFLTHDVDPDWMRFEDDSREMQKYMMENQLNGIAVFDATQVDEAHIVSC